MKKNGSNGIWQQKMISKYHIYIETCKDLVHFPNFPIHLLDTTEIIKFNVPCPGGNVYGYWHQKRFEPTNNIGCLQNLFLVSLKSNVSFAFFKTIMSDIVDSALRKQPNPYFSNVIWALSKHRNILRTKFAFIVISQSFCTNKQQVGNFYNKCWISQSYPFPSYCSRANTLIVG